MWSSGRVCETGMQRAWKWGLKEVMVIPWTMRGITIGVWRSTAHALLVRRNAGVYVDVDSDSSDRRCSDLAALTFRRECLYHFAAVVGRAGVSGLRYAAAAVRARQSD